MRPATSLAVVLSTLAPLAAWAPDALAKPPQIAPAVSREPVERRLHSDSVEASSFLWNDWNRFQENYHPNYALDDDPVTAWVEGAPASGAGEWIRVRVTALDGVSAVRLRLRNGYQKSKVLFAANGRVKKATLKLLPSGKTLDVTLTDTMDWQEVKLAQPAGPLEAIELKVGSVYEGTKYTDLCLSDLQVFVSSTARQNPVFEKLKFTALQAWKAQRVAAARQFRERTGKQLPLLAAYTVDTQEGAEDQEWSGSSDGVTGIGSALEAAAKRPEMKAWAASLAIGADAVEHPEKLFAAKVAPTDTRPIPPLDGFHAPELYDSIEGDGWWDGVGLPVYGVVGALETDTLRVIEGKSAVSMTDALAATAKGCTSKKGATYTWALRGKGTGADASRDLVRAVVTVKCGRVEVRDGREDVSVAQLLVFDEAGHLSLVAGPGYVSGFTWASVEGHDVVASAVGTTQYGKLIKLDRRVVTAQ